MCSTSIHGALLTISANYFQSNQRVIEWRSSVGSNGLAVVGDFVDSLHLDTTEKRQEAAEFLINHDQYIYLRILEGGEGGEEMVFKAMISRITYPLRVIQVKRAGRYRGPLVVQTMAQCWVDFDGAVEVPGFVEYDHFPYAALVLSATSVCFPFCTTLNIFTNHDIQVYRASLAVGQRIHHQGEPRQRQDDQEQQHHQSEGQIRQVDENDKL